MEQEVEDIKKLEAVLREERSRNNLQEDLEYFFNYVSEDDEQLDGYESNSSLDLENITEDKLHVAESKYLDINCINFTKSFSSIKHYLSAEEICVINSCKDNKLKYLLLLNRAKSIHLRGVLYKLYVSCNEVREHIIRANEKAKVASQKESDVKRTLLNRIGYPYFKIKQRFSCAPNEDALRKKGTGEICLDYMSRRRRWTVADQVMLKRCVCYQYAKSCTKETEDKIVGLTELKKGTNDDDATSQLEGEINECKAFLQALKDAESVHVPPLNGDVEINWKIISQQDLAGKHTPKACKAMWNLYLHPSINKAKWTESENTKLKELAEKYNYQDWEQIAKDLNTNRTAFTVCIHYRSSLLELCKGKFEPEEDEQLLKAVDMCRIGNYIPWSKVAQHFTNRDRSQLYNRYTGNLKVAYQKKGSFSEEEDILLMILVRKFGLNFSIICNYIPYRNRLQLSHRYNNYLNYEALQKGGWSVSDDSKIIAHVEKCGAKSWQKLIAQIPRRNESHFRHRYLHLKRWLAEHQGKSIEDIPRKSEGKPNHNVVFVRKVADMFNNSSEIPSLESIKEKIRSCNLKRGRKRTARFVNHMVDDELLQYFQSTQKLKTAKQITSSNMSNICSTVKSVLAIMKVVLVVPAKQHLHQISTLDYLDKEILSHLFGNVYSQHPHLVTPTAGDSSKKEIKIEFKLNKEISLLPPNLNTLVGMRSMLLKYNGFKSKLTKAVNVTNFSEAKDVINNSLKLKMNECDEVMRNIIAMHHQDFSLRLNVLFKWPAIMSLVEPDQSLMVFNSSRTCKPVVPRKVGRPKKDTSKIDLMNQRRLMKRNASLMADNCETNKPEDTCIENVLSLNTNGRKPTVVNGNKQKEITSGTTQCEALQEINEGDVLGNTTHDVGGNPRKKLKIDKSVNDELHEDIKKLDAVLLSETNSDIF